MSRVARAVSIVLALASGVIAQSKSSEPERIRAALEALGAQGEAEREAAIELLAGRAEVTHEAVAKRLVASEATVRRAALRVFRRAPKHAPMRSVASLLRDGDASVREEAALLFGVARPDGWVAELVGRLMLESDARVLRQMIVALGQAGETAAVAALIDYLTFATDEAMRKKTAQVLLAATGERFGLDANAWRRWWAERQAVDEKK